MAFTHVQGNISSNFNSISSSVVLTSNPTQGNIVCLSFNVSAVLTSLSISDASGNVYTVTPNSPSPLATGVGQTWLAYLLNAPANANKTINFTWNAIANGYCWGDEFGVSGGSGAFDKDVNASGTGSGTTISTPSITPTNSNSLLYAIIASSHSCNAPAPGATLGVWTGAAQSLVFGDAVEYDLSATGATAVNCTVGSSGATWSSLAMAFYIVSNPQSYLAYSPGADYQWLGGDGW